MLPILLNDPTGKDWTITRTQDKDGNITITLSLTVAVHNSSSKKINMESFTNAIIKQVESTFSESGKTTEGANFNLITNVNARIIDDLDDRKSSEHLIDISDSKEVARDYGVTNKFGGKEVLINSKYANNIMNGKDNNTIPHEMGHTLGLHHPDQYRTYFEGLIPWNTRNQYMNDRERKNSPYDVMYSGDSGLLKDQKSTKITMDQIRTIYRKYVTKSLNRD